MQQDFLSDIELYYSSHSIIEDSILIDGEEAHHITHVMRHINGDAIHITDGIGSIYKSIIDEIGKRNILARVVKTFHYENNLKNIFFCLPRLKSAERFEFALEKCVELGITNFIVFESKHTVAKGEKIERWEKILVSAMKQSLRSWLPKISYVISISEINKLDGKKIFFDQNSEMTFHNFLLTDHRSLITDNNLFIFGPEGGFDEAEISSEYLDHRIRLTENRLRTETAIVTAASILTLSY